MKLSKLFETDTKKCFEISNSDFGYCITDLPVNLTRQQFDELMKISYGRSSDEVWNYKVIVDYDPENYNENVTWCEFVKIFPSIVSLEDMLLNLEPENDFEG